MEGLDIQQEHPNQFKSSIFTYKFNLADQVLISCIICLRTSVVPKNLKLALSFLYCLDFNKYH